MLKVSNSIVTLGFDSRNPYWLSSGIVNQSGDGIMWSQPEIVLYDRDQMTRPGYPGR